jgi:CelD/BcsL family acetyltransferase involved in cellulose biosynthesis
MWWGTLLAVELIEDVSVFTALQREWTELLCDCDAANPFLTWSWLHAWWMHLSGRRGLALVTVRRGNRLVAVAPLSRTTARMRWPQQYEFLGTGLAGSDYLDVISRDTERRDAIDAIRSWLEQTRSTLRLDHVAEHASSRLLGRMLEPSGWQVREKSAGVCPFITLAGHTWDSYVNSRTASQRTAFRRRLSALGRNFSMRFDAVDSDERRRQAMEALFGFHDARWSGASTAFRTASLRAFHHDVTERALREGWLRLYVLSLDERIAAVMYGFFYRARFYFYQHGFDQQFSQHSVGRVLMGLSIRSAIEEGASEFDMLYGDEAYKFFWARDAHQLFRIEAFPPHLAGRLHRRAADAESALRSVAKRALSVHAHAT